MNYKSFTSAGIMAMMAMGASAGIANAIVVGAGDGYSVQENGESKKCTINSVGKIVDANGVEVKAALTAGHCGNPGERVFLDTQNGSFEIGKVSESRSTTGEGGTDDWAVIELDNRVELTDTSTSNNIFSALLPLPNAPENKIFGGIDGKAAPGTIIWKDGATSGRQLGVVLDGDGNTTRILTLAVPGDSGGAVYDHSGRLIGITSRGPVIVPILKVQDNNNAIEAYQESTGNTWYYYDGADGSPAHEPGTWSPFEGQPLTFEPGNLSISSEVIEQLPPEGQEIIADTIEGINEVANNDIAPVVQDFVENNGPEIKAVANTGLDHVQTGVNGVQHGVNAAGQLTVNSVLPPLTTQALKDVINNTQVGIDDANYNIQAARDFVDNLG